MTLDEFFNFDDEFETWQDNCIVEFSKTIGGGVSARLVFDEELAEVLCKNVPAVDVRVNSRGDIMLIPTPVGTCISTDSRPSVPLSRDAAKVLYDILKCDSEYARLVLSGGKRILLAPLCNQHVARNGDF